MEYKEWTFKALTDIWTGDADGRNGHFKETGFLGSLRWWFEVLVRGMGGSACDPTGDGCRCPDVRIKDAVKPEHHCVVCELFGCTGWARKFRLDVIANGGDVQSTQIRKSDKFVLRFIPLKPIQDKEWALLDLTLRLIYDYGAVGGKTVYKPSDEEGRETRSHHQDFGLISLLDSGAVSVLPRKHLEEYVREKRWRKVHDGFGWASLSNFWCVKGRYLTRKNDSESTFNLVLGRLEPKQRARYVNTSDSPASWLSGKQQESKKVFSFKNPPRTFGFVKPGTIKLDEMKKRLEQAWPDIKDEEFIKGDDILPDMFQEGGDQDAGA
ncbi:type III-B CRISPR module RAMP protein Cmr1 [Desulfotomaculum copahuensis]|uniref:type III-B CRISPR module RAMP protein Cmr1 n=1 Tax=Desulfotomaculum copahuensis TaxID=1838280 RepID=UPI001FA7CB9B|nr:type III-B CRISPR module RAMP protein Cmr1 [Desulfotomaculum copahuensis]